MPPVLFYGIDYAMSVLTPLHRWWTRFSGRTEPLVPRQRSVLCADPHGLHRMAYTEWGDPANPRVVVCVHGLTRNGRDFDELARALAADYRVVCPDVVGRGQSDWLTEPADYGFPTYIADMVTLIARLDVESVDWVGTSMGGLIGMLLAAQNKAPIRRLVLNDVGPVITAESLQRIGQYVGNAPRFASLADAVAYVRTVSAPFGNLSDDQWQALTRHCVRQGEDGSWTMVYDPGIGAPFRNGFVYADVNLWGFYESLRLPVLAIRGKESDLLTPEVHQAMGARGPRASLAEVAEVGHAPMFTDAGQIRLVTDFLLQE